MDLTCVKGYMLLPISVESPNILHIRCMSETHCAAGFTWLPAISSLLKLSGCSICGWIYT